jgi:Zn-dependent M28 family amino/carboxypeptidase
MSDDPLMTRRSPAALAVAALLLSGCLAGQTHVPRPSSLIDTRALVEDLRALSADDMQGRQVGTAGGARARAYLVERLKAAGVEPVGASYEHPFAFTDSGAVRHGVNVLGRIPGRQKPDRVIVLSAHYDHIGVRDGVVFNGADDNASGTAALLALARYFQDHRPAQSLIVAAFDGEEADLRGSAAFVAQPPVDRAAIAFNVNMDMIGRDPSNTLFAIGTFRQPFLKPLLDRVAASAPVRLRLGHDNPNEQGVEDWTKDSDHWSFMEAGIPAIYLGDEDFEQQHKATDDFETMTLDFFVGAVETALAVVQEVDANLEAIQAAR